MDSINLLTTGDNVMKKLKQQICRIAVLVLIITIAVPTGVKASTKSKITKLVDDLRSFVFYNIELNFLRQEDVDRTEYVVRLNKKNMAAAAAFSILDSETKGTEKGNYTEYKLSGNKLKKRSKNLFGKSTSAVDLSTDQEQGSVSFVFQKSGQPYLLVANYETELDIVRNSLSVKKTGSSTFTVTEKMYCGYWGGSTGEPNYTVVYKLKKNSSSSYGYIVKDIKIKRIDT